MLVELTTADQLPAKSIGIDAMLARREALKALLCSVSEELKGAELMAQAGGFGSLFQACNGSGNRFFMPPLFKGDIPGMMKMLDQNAWETLLVESGMRTFMNATQRQLWDSRLKKGEFPEFTRENIEITFSDLYQRRREIFEDGVVDVFLRLNPRHGKGFRTNDGMAFKKRFIVRGLIGWSGLAADSGCNDIDDLIRCFCVMAGKPEPDAREGVFVQVRELLETHRSSFTLENEWISMKVHPAAGTGHVTLKNSESVDALNAVLAKKLPLALGKMKAA